jgi:hypothetical protein
MKWFTIILGEYFLQNVGPKCKKISQALPVCPPNIPELLLAFSISHATQQHGKVRMVFRGLWGLQIKIFQTSLKSTTIWTNVSQQ